MYFSTSSQFQVKMNQQIFSCFTWKSVIIDRRFLPIALLYTVELLEHVPYTCPLDFLSSPGLYGLPVCLLISPLYKWHFCGHRQLLRSRSVVLSQSLFPGCKCYLLPLFAITLPLLTFIPLNFWCSFICLLSGWFLSFITLLVVDVIWASVLDCLFFFPHLSSIRESFHPLYNSVIPVSWLCIVSPSLPTAVHHFDLNVFVLI